MAARHQREKFCTALRKPPTDCTALTAARDVVHNAHALYICVRITLHEDLRKYKSCVTTCKFAYLKVNADG